MSRKSNAEIVDALIQYVQHVTKKLNDTDYCTVLEEVSCDLDARVEAKRRESK